MASSPKEALSAAFDKAVASFSRDMPLLLHGSGDVDPSQVLPETAQLVAALTAHYLQNLTHAALESHQMQQDGDFQYYYPVPPPSRTKSRQPALPPVWTPPETTITAADHSTDLTTTSSLLRTKTKKRRLQPGWDEELPTPKIHGVPAAAAAATTNDIPLEENPDDWVGLAGVDLREHRARAAHVHGALTPGCLIFPVCHDTYIYGRIRDSQTFKRSLDFLVDPVVQERVKATRRRPGAAAAAKDKTDPETSNQEDPEEDDEVVEDAAGDEHDEDPGQIPKWPGLEDFLPVYRM